MPSPSRPGVTRAPGTSRQCGRCCVRRGARPRHPAWCVRGRICSTSAVVVTVSPEGSPAPTAAKRLDHVRSDAVRVVGLLNGHVPAPPGTTDLFMRHEVPMLEHVDVSPNATGVRLTGPGMFPAVSRLDTRTVLTDQGSASPPARDRSGGGTRWRARRACCRGTPDRPPEGKGATTRCRGGARRSASSSAEPAYPRA